MKKFNQALIQLLNQYEYANINIVVTNSDSVLYQEAFGYLDLETKALATPQTIYRIASVSKTILALAAMMLVDRGKLDLDQDISNYLGFEVRNPHHPTAIISTRMLMTQTSSITDGFDDDDLTNDTIRYSYNGVNGTNLNVSLEELLVPSPSPYYSSLTFDQDKPGTKFIYSNFGCGILACLIEKISGLFYDDFLQENLFKPLNLDASFKIERIKKFHNISSLYNVKNEKEYVLTRNKEQFLNNTYPIWPLGQNYRGPAGGLFISMLDLSIIMRGMMKGDLPNLSKQTMSLMFEKNWEGHVRNYRAKCLQMNIFTPYYDITTFGHFGSAYGVRSFMLFSPKYQKGICFITSGAHLSTVEHHLCNLHRDVYILFLQHFILEV